MLSAAQGGQHEDGRETFGHSIIVDPWGRVLAEAGTEPGVILAEIDTRLVADARSRIPTLNMPARSASQRPATDRESTPRDPVPSAEDRSAEKRREPEIGYSPLAES